MKELKHVPAAFIDQAWRDGAHKLAEACATSGGEVTGDQLKMMLARGERNLIAIVDGSTKCGWLVSRIDQLPNVRVLHVCELYAPGSMFAECWEQLQEHARSNGCSEIRCAAKPAQARLYRMRFGFEPIYETLRVTL